VWLYSRLTTIAAALSSGRKVFARVAAVQLGLPIVSLRGHARLKKIASIAKFNPNWSIEPRNRRGRWTNQGNEPVIPVIAPFSPECLAEIEAAKKRCFAQYAALGGGLGPVWMMRCIRGYVPSDCGY